MAPTFRKVALLTAALVPLLAFGCDRSKPAAPSPVTPPPVAGRASTQPRPPYVPGVKPIAAIKRVVLISVDGMRPDLIFRSGSIHMAELLDEGTFTLWGRTSDLPYTLPSHVSMMTGVRPTRHGIEENEYRLDHYPQFPTIFEAAHEKGLTTAFVAGKSKLKVLCKPGSVDHDFVEDQVDEKVAERAVRVLREHKPNLLVVHFRGCDYAGHFYEWGSPQQLAVLREIDAGVGQILQAIESGGLAGETAVLLTADHGGAGITHWEDHRGSTIPWVIKGPGIRRQFDLDRLGSTTPVKTEDTFATIVALLGLPMPQDVDGKPVLEIVDVPPREMLRDRP